MGPGVLSHWAELPHVHWECFLAFCRLQTAGTCALRTGSWLQLPLMLTKYVLLWERPASSVLTCPSPSAPWWAKTRGRARRYFGPTAARFLWKVFVKLWQHVKDKRGRNWLCLPSVCLCWLWPQEQLPSLLNSPKLLCTHPQKSLSSLRAWVSEPESSFLQD